MRTVAILTPAFAHSVDAYFYHSIIDTIKASAAWGINVIPLTWPGEALVQHGRNALVEMVIRKPVDDFFWIDSDQEWQPSEFLALLNHDVDVVGATYRKKTDDVEEYTARTRAATIARDGLWTVEGLGTGFLKVSRRAMERVYEASEVYENNGQQWRMVFDVQVVDGRLWGEDMLFCEKLKALGYLIHLDPSFTVGHNGYKRYKGDFLAYAERLLQTRGHNAQRLESPRRGGLHSPQATAGGPSVRDSHADRNGGLSVGSAGATASSGRAVDPPRAGQAGG